MKSLAIAIPLLIGCGSSRPIEMEPQGWMGHMAAADAHERRARAHEESAVTSESQVGYWSCGDVVLNQNLRTGGEPVTFGWLPCFDAAEEGAAHQRHATDKELRAAQHERREAGRLLQAEVAACRGIPERERDHSPLEHTKAIAEIVPHRESGKIRGVHIEMKPVPGLTAEWMQRAIACNQARYAALGEPSEQAASDPTLIPGARVEVAQRGDHVDILVITESEVDGKIALERAKNLAPPQTALR